MIMVTDSFSTDYRQARAAFLGKASALGAHLAAFEYPALGPDGERLWTDTAWIGRRDAPALFILLSGMHGIEGFAGSAAQIDWMSRGPIATLRDDVAILLVHAVNPYGFAWERRVTHENVDLNRNWVDFSAGLPANESYDEIHDLLCPANWEPETLQRTSAGLADYIESKGLAALQGAVSRGQHDHPDGLFFAGSAPSWSRRNLEGILAGQCQAAERIVCIDVHTGLGVRGHGEAICLLPDDDPAFHRARRLFGTTVGNTVSSAINGEFLAKLPSLLPNAETTAIALEFGTVPVLQVLHALRSDAWLHAHGDPTGAAAAQVRAAVRAAFYDEAVDWKAMVLGQTYLGATQAIRGLEQG